jgi:hypothetical protein
MKKALSAAKQMNLTTLENHYWLKVELIAFCKANQLPTLGSKVELIQRIKVFMTTGRKAQFKKNRSTVLRDSLQEISVNTLVNHYKNDAATRQFFVKQVGKHFHFDAYLRQFTNKNNITPGLTYGDLVQGWLKEASKRKEATYQSTIGSQFEYNQFTRDFFANERGKSRSDAIQAWKVLKALPGKKTYANYKVALRKRD